MKVSVVITTYNRRGSLERCLKSLAHQDFPAGEHEVIVVADGCTDGTVDLLRGVRFPCAYRWIDQQNAGQPAAQNVGTAAARGEIVLFIDDDCICDAGLLAAHAEAHRSSEKLVVIGAMLLHPESPAGTLRDVKQEYAEREYRRACSETARRSDLILCANSSIAREGALKCRFDPALRRMHDVEAGQRLWAMGYRPKFGPNAVAYELFTKTVDGVLHDAWEQGRLEALLSKQYPEFKPVTSLVGLNQGNALKRFLRKQLGLHARTSEFALRAASRAAESLRGRLAGSQIARRILQARIGARHLAGALKEAGSWRKLDAEFGKRVPVLMYHNVGSPKASEYPGLTIPPAEFDAQMRLLRRIGYRTVTPSEWLRWREEGGALPERPIMLVFDDGYEDACLHAFPILQRYGFTAACMIVTGCIGATNRWDEEAGRPSFRMISADQIREWAQKGIEFGGHTRSHPDLTHASDEIAEQEIGQCKRDLAGVLSEDPLSFAYPFGGLSRAAEDAVGRYFRIGFSAWPGRLHLGTDLARVPRIWFLPGESKFGMWCRLKLGKNPFEALRNRWRMLMGRPLSEEPYLGPALRSSQPDGR